MAFSSCSQRISLFFPKAKSSWLAFVFVHILMHLLQGLEHFVVGVSMMWVAALCRAPSLYSCQFIWSFVCVCVYKQPFYNLRVTNRCVCWLVQRGEKKGLTLQCRMVPSCFHILCYFGPPFSQWTVYLDLLTVNKLQIIAVIRNMKSSSFCFYILMPPEFLVSSVADQVNSRFGFISLERVCHMWCVAEVFSSLAEPCLQ